MEDEQNQLMDVDHVFYHEFTKIINSMQEAHNVLPEFAADEGYYRRNLYDSITTMMEFREFIKSRIDNNLTLISKGGTGGYYA
tara:strand:+ start:178 stop:426 length:249 start_codon:yes stop_codon:yes gene_type:complete